MPNKNKIKGNRNEHRSMAWLSKQGYRCTRSAGSLGEWDIIGVGVVDTVLVQVKTNHWPSRKEMEVLNAFKVPPCVRKILHRWNDYAREPVVKELL